MNEQLAHHLTSLWVCVHDDEIFFISFFQLEHNNDNRQEKLKITPVALSTWKNNKMSLLISNEFLEFSSKISYAWRKEVSLTLC